MRRTIAALSALVWLGASVANADSGKIHVCRAAGSTSTAKSVEIPAGSAFAVGDSAHHIVKTTEAAKLGMKCASIAASSGSDPESQPIKQGKTPITAQFALSGVTLEGTVSKTFKPSGTAVSPRAQAPAGKATPAPTPTAPAPTPVSKSPTAAKTSGSSSGSSGTAPTVTDAAAPAGSTAKCKDGTYSKSQHRSGTCSHHGGVADWLTP
jgi:hypothetical protein